MGTEAVGCWGDARGVKLQFLTIQIPTNQDGSSKWGESFIYFKHCGTCGLVYTTQYSDITINKYSAAALGGTAFPIASTISVPADATLIVIDKTTAIYLKENESIGATAGTASDLVVTASWEEINA